MTRLYIGNLSSEVTDDSLQQFFSNKGFQVTSARVICDREGGRSRGFGFVELGSPEDAERAIGELNGFDMEGHALQVNEARPRQARDGHAYSRGLSNSKSRRGY